MKQLKKLIVVLVVCNLLVGCNNKNGNPLNQMPAKQAAKLLLAATKSANAKASLPQAGDTYLMCLNHQLNANNCNKLYRLMAENFKAQGLDLNETTLAQFQPSRALREELHYLALTDDEV